MTDHLWNKHFSAITEDVVRGSKIAFRDAHRGNDYMPLGQWLIAMERCQDGHEWQGLGEHHFGCASDNCDYCAQCGVENHD